MIVGSLRSWSIVRTNVRPSVVRRSRKRVNCLECPNRTCGGFYERIVIAKCGTRTRRWLAGYFSISGHQIRWPNCRQSGRGRIRIMRTKLTLIILIRGVRECVSMVRALYVLSQYLSASRKIRADLSDSQGRREGIWSRKTGKRVW